MSTPNPPEGLANPPEGQPYAHLPPPPPVPAQPYPDPSPYVAVGDTVPTKATVSVVLGVIGLIVFPVICSVLAVILGYQARAEIDKSVVLGGRRRATTGIVLGWIGLGFWVLIMLVALGSA